MSFAEQLLRKTRAADRRIAELEAERGRWLWVARQLAGDHPDEVQYFGETPEDGPMYVNPWDDMIVRLAEDPDCPFPDDDEIEGGNLCEYLDRSLRQPDTEGDR